MDPDKTFANMITALADGDTEKAREHFEALIEWLERGGFPPRALVQKTANGSDGYVRFKRDTGEITEREGYENIKRIDVEEWLRHYGKEMPDSLDILDVGYYTYDGHYEPPVSDFRQRLKAR